MNIRKPKVVACSLLWALAASPVWAIRVDGAGVPAASAVRGAAQQPAQTQVDESASLREGVIAAVGENAERVQIQGVWIDVVAGQTQVLRKGQPARADSLKVGEVIRFTLAVAGPAQSPSMRVIYAP